MRECALSPFAKYPRSLLQFVLNQWLFWITPNSDYNPPKRTILGLLVVVSILSGSQLRSEIIFANIKIFPSHGGHMPTSQCHQTFASSYNCGWQAGSKQTQFIIMKHSTQSLFFCAQSSHVLTSNRLIEAAHEQK